MDETYNQKKELGLLQKVIINDWRREPGTSFARAHILDHEVHPEGLDVERIRFFKDGYLPLKKDCARIISVLRGEGKLSLRNYDQQIFHLEVGVHIYLPFGIECVFDAKQGTEVLHVSTPLSSQAFGKKILLRNEIFLSACASGSQSLRWILTPQYLSRRIFLYHDQTLLSKSGYPISWFHTTMFDVVGLPMNEEGNSVFRMSYNSRTEANFCYEVKGTARVRMAQHPYQDTKQLWGKWLPLDGDSTYHLNEIAGGSEEEYYVNEATQAIQTFRNKHEVYISNGHVSLFCLFDPASTGIEQHQPGEYSDYEPLSQVLETKTYKAYTRKIAKYDGMVDKLSLAKARGELNSLRGSAFWKLYLQGREMQRAIEAELIIALIAEGNGRERIVRRWQSLAADLMGESSFWEK